MTKISPNFYYAIKIVFTISKIFGFSTISITNAFIKTSNKKWIYNLTWVFAQIALVTYSIIIILNDKNSKIIFKATDIILLTLSTIYVAVTWLFGILYEQRHTTLICELNESEKQFRETYGDKFNYKNTKTFIKLRTIYYLTFSLLFLTLFCWIVIKDWSMHTLLQSLCYIIPIILTMSSLLLFTVYVNIIQSYLQFLNKDIDKLNSVTLASNLFSSKNHRTQIQRFKNVITVLRRMSKLHHILCCHISTLMEVYGVVLLAMIGLSFASVVIAVYYTFCMCHGYRDDKMHVPQMFSMFLAMEMIDMCQMCDNTVDEVNKMGILIHKIESDEQDLRDELEIFSLQIAIEKVDFNAAGFFSIGYSLLFSIIGASTTYIIILIQLSN